MEFEEAGLRVSYVGCEQVTPDMDEYEYLVEKVNGEEVVGSLNVKQLQYVSWPDHGIPDTVQDIDSLVEKSLAKLDAGERVLYHCSAGIGRTGTLITITHLIHDINKSH